jgi:hypothetical protein
LSSGSASLSYYVPPLGSVSVTLRDESAILWRFLDEAGEVSRLRQLDHLGLIRTVWDGAHHPRWEYAVSTLYLIERCREPYEVRLSAAVSNPFSVNVLSSGYELLRCWALLLNIGHLHWTFSAERALLFELRQSDPATKQVLDALPPGEVRAWAGKIIASAHVYQLFQVLAFIRLKQLDDRLAPHGYDVDLLGSYLALYVISGEPTGDRMAELRRIYRNLRRLAYLALDTHYIPSAVVLDLPDLLSNPRRFARHVLHAADQDEDELRSLERQLYRDIYMGSAVLNAGASRERPLRQSIREALKREGVAQTVQLLADGTLQQAILADEIETVLRLPAWVGSPFDELLLKDINVAELQENSDRDVSVRNSGTRVTWWRAPYGKDWVLQTHAPQADIAARVSAYDFGFNEMVRVHRSLAADTPWLPDERLQEIVFGRLAAELVVGALRLFFRRQVVWEWQTTGRSTRAYFTTRRGADGLLSDAEHSGVSQDRIDELSSLRATLPGSPTGYLALAATNLVAYDEEGTEQVAELDGVVVQADGLGHVTLTLVEAKRQRRSARGAAERQIRQVLKGLRVLPGAAGAIDSVQTGQLARAWVALEIAA